MLATFRLLSLLAGLLTTLSASAQSLDDPRLDPLVIDYIQRNATVPVLISLDGRASDARHTWRQITRTLGNRYGMAETPPNRQQEIFAELNRFGLMLVLNFEQVREIYLPFELTRPGD
jgi:hypothetical protein